MLKSSSRGSAVERPRLPRKRSDLIVRILDGETVVLDRQSGLIHQLNRTASLIWGGCDGTKPVRTIVGELVARFAVGRAQAERDVAIAIERFGELSLLLDKKGN